MNNSEDRLGCFLTFLLLGCITGFIAFINEGIMTLTKFVIFVVVFAFLLGWLIYRAKSMEEEKKRDEEWQLANEEWNRKRHEELVEKSRVNVIVSNDEFRKIVSVTVPFLDFQRQLMRRRGFKRYLEALIVDNPGYQSDFLLSQLVGSDVASCMSLLGFNKTIDVSTKQGQLTYLVCDILRGYLDEYVYNETFEEFAGNISMGKIEDYPGTKTIIDLVQMNLDMYVGFTKVETNVENRELGMCNVLHNYDVDQEKRIKHLLKELIVKLAECIETDPLVLANIMSDRFGENLTAASLRKIDETGGYLEKEGGSLEELNRLIGLKPVKDEIRTLANFVHVQKLRQQKGLKATPISYHCVFSGNPGTGKTTVARILAGIYKELGVLAGGQLIETDRSGLVAEYVGQTAVKTNKIIDKALNGVLFIDEAYTLATGEKEDYGNEAIATLLKRMEDDRDRLVVVLAGYTDQMETFINSNPGLRSRFSRQIEFPDYSVDELYEIFCLSVRSSDFHLSEGASERLYRIIEKAVRSKKTDFGNARYVRNLFEKTIERQANRLASQEEVSEQDLTLLTGDDIYFLPNP